MRKPDRSSPEPWVVRETKVDLAQLGRSESIFALSNGHIGWRANLDEGEPHAISGSYLNAVYEEVPLPYAEEAFGYPEAGQAIVNVTNGKIIRLLVDDEPVLGKDEADPRSGTLIESPLEAEFSATSERGAVLIHSTRHSKLRIAAAMDHIARGPRGTETRTEAHPDDARFTVTSKLASGQRLTLVKFVAYGWSSVRTVPALRSQVEGALATASEHGWDGLARAQRKYLADFWSRADVELEGDDEVQQGI